MTLEPSGESQTIGRVSVDSEGKGFEPLEQLERRVSREGGSHLALRLHSHFSEEGMATELLGEDEAVVSGEGLVELGESRVALPFKVAARDDDSTESDSVSARK